ncbi:MAG: hypothetical protein ACLP52_22960 [Streptosporangiaceae bacterium]
MVERRSIQSKVTTRSAIVLGLSFVIAGGLLLWWSGTSEWKSNEPVQAFLGQLGGLVLATGLLAVAWDLFGRRAFADEVLAKARLSADVAQAGIVRVTNQYLAEVEWATLFRNVSKLDIVVAYGATWRNTHRASLQQVARQSDARIRIFLPDPDDDRTVAVLADRFNTASADLVAKINEAIRDFQSLAVPGGATIEVWLRAGDAVFSCYRFDSNAVLTLYSHGRERRSQVPTFVIGGGELFDFVYSELTAIAAQSRPAP